VSEALRIAVDDPDLVVGVVEVTGARIAPATAALSAAIDTATARVAGTLSGGGEWPPADVRAAVRDLLRRGGYKPTGRGKPASEFLAQAAGRAEFPRINGAVDALNLVSLESGLPISLLDADRASAGGAALVVRLGLPGESYVFNAAGHAIDVAGLLCVARDHGPPLGNAVKDSMETKLREDSSRLLAVVWGSARIADAARMREVAASLARLLAQETGGATTTGVLGA